MLFIYVILSFQFIGFLVVFYNKYICLTKILGKLKGNMNHCCRVLLPSYLSVKKNYIIHTTNTMASTQTTVTTTRQPTSAAQKAENFAHNSQNNNGISLVLPRVFPNWNHHKIKQVFIQCGWGFVERVDVTPPGRIPKGRFKTAFVHFRPNSWNNRNRTAREVLSKLQQGPKSHVEITYDEPWFWKVYISSALKPDEAPKMPERPAVKIDTDASVPALQQPPTVAPPAYDVSAQFDEEMRSSTPVTYE